MSNCINKMAQEIHENAVAHGWWDEDRKFPEIVALCHSELSEALEEYREGRPNEWRSCTADCASRGTNTCELKDCRLFSGGDKPEGIAVEMIDCIIRILDWCAKEGVDVDRILREKCEYNKSRPYKHGGKVC